MKSILFFFTISFLGIEMKVQIVENLILSFSQIKESFEI